MKKTMRAFLFSLLKPVGIRQWFTVAKSVLTFSVLISLSAPVDAQVVYQSPLGFTVSMDNSWKRLPREVTDARFHKVKEFFEYRKDIHYDACYQKVGRKDMEYPYILFKNIYSTTTSEAEMRKVQTAIADKTKMDKAVQQIVTDKMDIELSVGKTYFDAQNNLLLFTYDMGISSVGNLIGLIGLYVGRSASLQICCYSRKSEFKTDQMDFLKIIYSIKDKGMKTSLSAFIGNQSLAAKYYNEAKESSAAGNNSEAIRLYTKAIENYPEEATFDKSEAFYNRGWNKRQMNDLKGAIADYTEAIKIRPDYYKAYNNRGYAKMILEDFSGAIYDFTMTIKYDNYNTDFTATALGNRGLAKLNLNQDGCTDLKKAIELGNNKVASFFDQNCK